MPETVINVENLSKHYRLGQIGSNTLREDLSRLWAKVRGKEDPTLKIGHENILNEKSVAAKGGLSEYIWALKDINFKVHKGEVLGIIGKNGAGKSTLLKILSKVTSPTKGSIKVNGRIASLLEVGTGFHPELSGRENIYLNGAILGMTKAEIKSKFDEIVDFSGVEKYIDTPVKRYSSGMYVRLAFAVAAHLDPEILVVDEVLAVGDAEFQKKAIGKMQDISSGQGRTVLFVSHNMDSILRLCERCILLENSEIKIDDNADKVINYYLERNFGTNSFKKFELRNPNRGVSPILIKIHNENFEIKDNFFISEKIGITFEYSVLSDSMKVIPGLKFFNRNNVNIFDTHENSDKNDIIKTKGKYTSTIWLQKDFFNEGILIVDVALLRPDPFEVYFYEKDAIAFNMVDKGKNITRGEYAGTFPGIIRPSLNWETLKINKE